MSAPAKEFPPPGTDEQRDALRRIVSSGFLDRAPNLSVLLRYVCEQTLSGDSASIKEYNIAVEAFGRPADFDQKKDAIVRVEAHRLRKRLSDYYRTVGVADPVEITLPSGTYIPRFPFRDVPSPVLSPVVVREAPAPEVTPVSVPQRRWPRLAFAMLAISVAIAAVLIYRFQAVQPERSVKASVPSTAAIPAVAPGEPVRFMCGSQAATFADREGSIWSADRYFEGGTAMTSPPRPIARTTTPELYLTRREGEFSYRIPLRPGVYELRLHFAETVFGEGNIAGGGESSRVFTVLANGTALPISDIVAEAGGPNTATVRVFRDISPAADGFLHLKFVRVKENAFVNAIEVVPGSPKRLLPVRIVARPTGFTSGSGERWDGDRYVSGGQPVNRQEPVAGDADPGLFRGERYGNFSYEIPVDPRGRYSVTLHFAEMWFGPGRPGGGGDGSRVFDVYCNGRTLLRNLDVFRTAGGSLRSVTRTFRGLEPNAQGKLQLMFVPVRNYAMVNAIEVTEDGR